MALFNIGKIKGEAKEPSCCCSGNGTPNQDEGSTNYCCPEAKDGICCIKVLGAGCASCRQQYENARAAVKNTGLDVEVEYITDMANVMEYGVMSMPALVVNEKVVSKGKVLKPAEIERLLRSYIKSV